MAQQISDLVINLDVDSATFTEQIARIKGQLSGMADESDKVQTRMRSAAEVQISALKTTSTASAGAVSDMQKRQADAAAGLQSELQRVSKSVDETYQRVTGLNQRYRENDAQAEALARRQDALAESFFRQIDGVRSLSGETRSLASVQEQFRKARAQGNITQGDYLSLISRTTARQKELQQVEEKANQAREKFLRQLKAQVVEQKLSGTELLRMKAAQVGAGDAAEVYIRKLEAAKVATHSLGLESAGARRELGVLMGELLRGNFGALRGSGITLANRAGWIPSYRPPGYDGGGYTGHGGKYEPAGVVHRGEFVFTKEATSRIGVSNLYRMMRGYAAGGYVGNAASPASVSPSGVMVNMGGVYISSGSEQQSTQRSAIDSNGILKQLKPAIISVVSEQAQRPGTPLWKAIKEGR